MRNLRRTPHSKFLIRLAELCYHTTCLHSVRNKSLIDQALFDNYATIGLGLLENLVDLIRLRVYPQGNVGTELLIEQRGAFLHSFFDIGHRRQRLIIDLDQVARIASSVAVIRNYHRDRITIETYLALGQRATDAHTFFHQSQRSGNGNIANDTFHVFRRVNRYDARMVEGRFSVNALNPSMTIRTAQHSHMEHAKQFDIINVGRLTGNQARILTPLHRRTNYCCNTHVCLSFLSPEITVARTVQLFCAFATATPPRLLERQPLYASVQQHTGQHARCSDSLCSGRYCPRDLCVSRLQSG